MTSEPTNDVVALRALAATCGDLGAPADARSAEVVEEVVVLPHRTDRVSALKNSSSPPKRDCASTPSTALVLEEINRSGGDGGVCHAQMYTMGTLLRHGSDEQKGRYLPEIAAGRLR